MITMKQYISAMFNTYKKIIEQADMFDCIKDKVKTQLTTEQNELLDLLSSEFIQKISSLEDQANSYGYSFIHGINGDVLMMPLNEENFYYDSNSFKRESID